MAQSRNFFLALFAVTLGLCGLSHCDGLRITTDQKRVPESGIFQEDNLIEVNCFKKMLTSQLGVVEVGNNEGIEVEQYLNYTGLSKGYAWCAALQSWSLGQCKIDNPKSAWSPALLPKSKIVYRSGDDWPKDEGALVYGIYFSKKKRVAHVGGVIKMLPDKLIGIEGNTNDGGAREGDRVIQKIRPKSTIYEMARY